MAQILLLEPNTLLAKQYTSVLEEDGHKVMWCQDGQSAILMADAHTPDVLVLELLLAGHSGIEFLYEFRSYNEWAKIQQSSCHSLSKLQSATTSCANWAWLRIYTNQRPALQNCAKQYAVLWEIRQPSEPA